MRSTLTLSFLALASLPFFICTASAQTRPTTDPSEDPRPALDRFFDAVRHGNKAAALDCWDNDVERDNERASVQDLVDHLVDELIANYRLECALADKLPAEYAKARQANDPMTPTPAEIAAAHFTVFRRLAIVKWGKDQDSGFPMEFDSRPDQQRWKISMRQWHTTTGSSVGDPMLLSGWGAKAKDATTKEIMDGKLTTLEAVQHAFMRHMTELAKTAKE